MSDYMTQLIQPVDQHSADLFIASRQKNSSLNLLANTCKTKNQIKRDMTSIRQLSVTLINDM